VDEEQIMEDYLLTNQYFRRPAQMYGQLSEEALDALWRVQPSYLMASVDGARPAWQRGPLSDQVLGGRTARATGRAVSGDLIKFDSCQCLS
jgi:hypothetical protein